MAVAGRSPAEILARAEALEELAVQQLWQRDFVELDVEYHPKSPNILAECYFALTDAYKRRWGLKGKTDWTKVAALTAVTIAVCKPLRPAASVSAEKLNDTRWDYLNPNFSMYAAYDGIPQMFYARAFDEQRRVLRSFRDCQIHCLKPMMDEAIANDGDLPTTWELHLSDDADAAYLDMAVSYFVMLRENEHLLLASGRR